MNSGRSAPALAAILFLLAPSASTAQADRAAAGVIERWEGVSYCMQGTHVLRDPCTGRAVLLDSGVWPPGGIDDPLEPFLCKEVLVEGPDVGVECPVILVNRIEEIVLPCTDCDTGRPGVCAAGAISRPPQGSCGPVCVSLLQPSTELCDALDNDCDGSVDEDAICDVCTAGDADGDGACDSADDCLALYNPGQEDLDGDGEGDGCDLTIASPLDASTLDCRAGALPTVITWEPGPYDRFKVQISPSPGFPERGRLSSGERWLAVSFWAVPQKKWRRACAEARPYVYVRLLGVDMSARPKRIVLSEPSRVDVVN